MQYRHAGNQIFFAYASTVNDESDRSNFIDEHSESAITRAQTGPNALRGSLARDWRARAPTVLTRQTRRNSASRGDETAALVEAEVVKPVAGVVEEVEPRPSRLVRVVIDVMPDVTGSRPEAALRTPVTPSAQHRSSGCCRTFSGGLAALTAQAPVPAPNRHAKPVSRARGNGGQSRHRHGFGRRLETRGR